MQRRSRFSQYLQCLAVATCVGWTGSAGADQELPIFDAHMHYSHDAWEVVPPKQVVEILKKAGVKRAMVSSSNNDGTRMLQDVAPEIIVPELRPYRSRGEISTWAKDPTLIPFLEDLLAKRRYVAIGEFHIYGADADLPNMRKVVELAKKHGLYLHSHSDLMRSIGTFSRTPPPRCYGRIPASSGRRRCGRCCAVTRPCGAISPS